MLAKLAFVLQRLKRYEKNFVMINKDWGGGQFLDFMGGHRAHGGSPVPPLGKTLAIIFNESITLGIFPDKLKCAKVIPIHKKVPPLIYLTTGPFHFFLYEHIGGMS